MKNSVIFFFTITMLGCFNLYSQSENYAKFYNKGNKLLDNNFEQAEKNFRIAINDSLSDLKATFNLSNQYYNEGLYDEAISRQIEATKLAKDNSEKHRTFHNLGNSLMKKQLCSEAVLAYKNALRNNPNDDETRYNLALAKKCEEEQEQNNDDKNKDDKEDKNDEKKDDENKNDQQDKNDDKQVEWGQSRLLSCSRLHLDIETMAQTKLRHDVMQSHPSLFPPLQEDELKREALIPATRRPSPWKHWRRPPRRSCRFPCPLTSHPPAGS